MQTLPLESSDEATLSLSLEDTLEPETPCRRPGAVFEAAGVSHAGRVRARNEDAYGVFPDLGFCAVADGLGGHPGGDVASALAIHEAHRFLIDPSLGGSAGPGPGAPSAGPAALGELLAAAVVHANTAVHAASLVDPRRTGMATTFVGLLVADGRAAIAHAGDSRAYRIRGGLAERLTTDHSMLELYLKVYGEQADPEMAEMNAGIVTRTVGGRPALQPDVLTCTVEAGDVFLLCSDGLWGLVADDEMAFALAGAPTLETALARLIATAYNRGAHDNVTAVLVRCAA